MKGRWDNDGRKKEGQDADSKTKEQSMVAPLILLFLSLHFFVFLSFVSFVVLYPNEPRRKGAAFKTK